MIRFKQFLLATLVLGIAHIISPAANAQRLYIGSTPADSQYSATGGYDGNGRARNVDGRVYDRYGQNVDDFGWFSRYSRMPSNTASGYSTGSYYTGGYYGIGYPGVLGGYSGGYSDYTGDARLGPAATTITPPRTVIVPGVAPTRTVMNNGTRGSVIEYTQNGNGYIATPGSTYQTVISNGPSIMPYTTVVQPTQPPVTIESRRTAVVAKTFPGTPSAPNRLPSLSSSLPGRITLIYPKEAKTSLSYVLNGTTYTIKPGYSQTFPDDRRWSIEFFRTGNGSPVMRYDLKAGTYFFLADTGGWDLKPELAGDAAFENTAATSAFDSASDSGPHSCA